MSDLIDAKMLSDWRINYGLDTSTPSEAMRWWHDSMDGKAPAGAVAALGLCIAEIERLRAERDALLNALETMLIGACAVGVPHAGERQVLQECVDAARDVIDAARKEHA